MTRSRDTVTSCDRVGRAGVKAAYDPRNGSRDVAAKQKCVNGTLKTFGLFVLTALAEIVGCYLPFLVLRGGKSAWLLAHAPFSLALFAWLLSLHPTAAGRVYAAYGSVYIAVAILWLRAVDGIRPTTTDVVGVAVSLLGMGIIMFGPRAAPA